MSRFLNVGMLPPAMRQQAEAKLRAAGTVRTIQASDVPPKVPPRLTALVESERLNYKPRGKDLMPRIPRIREKNATPSDKLLWQIRATGLPAPVPEHRFHPLRKWRFDFAWPDRKVALEIEGLTHEGGRHQRLAGYAADLEKYNAALLQGWQVLRVTGRMIVKGRAIAMLERTLNVPRETAHATRSGLDAI